MKAEILKAVENNKKVIVYDLIFTSFRNWNGEREYKMQSDRNRDKWKTYDSEKEYIKAIMQRVNYYIKRGFPNVIEIQG